MNIINNFSSVPATLYTDVKNTVNWLTTKPSNNQDALKKIAVLATFIIGSAAVFAGLAFSGGLPLIAIPVIAVAVSLIASLVLGSHLRLGPVDPEPPTNSEHQDTTNQLGSASAEHQDEIEGGQLGINPRYDSDDKQASNESISFS